MIDYFRHALLRFRADFAFSFSPHVFAALMLPLRHALRLYMMPLPFHADSAALRHVTYAALRYYADTQRRRRHQPDSDR